MDKIVLNESIASSRISNFLRNHGGLSCDSPKDGLGDISDDAIVTCQEVSSAKEAVDIVFRNNRSKDFYIWYLANDGSAIVVAVDKTKFDTGYIYGWSSSKKYADRYWEKERPDGRETYEYNPFVAYHAGVKNNADFQNKKYWAPILNPDREGAARKLASKRAAYDAFTSKRAAHDALRENLKLTETDVRQMVAECTRKVLMEAKDRIEDKVRALGGERVLALYKLAATLGQAFDELNAYKNNIGSKEYNNALQVVEALKKKFINACAKCGLSEADIQAMIDTNREQEINKLNPFGVNIRKNMSENNMKKNVVKLNEAQLRNVIAECVRTVLNEEYVLPDVKNVVSAELASEYGFTPEYTGYENGLEIWGRRIDFNPCDDEGQRKCMAICNKLGIKRLTTYSVYPSKKIRITVKTGAQAGARGINRR